MTKKLTKPKKTRRVKSAAEQLFDAALIWHAATVLSGQCDNDSSADAYLRKKCVRYLKQNPDAGGVAITMAKL